MKLTVYGSGSSGNGYSLQSEQGDTLLIEAGVSAAVPLRDIPYSCIQGLIVSHSHGDHAGKLKEYLAKRINTYMAEETIHSMKMFQDYSGFMPFMFSEERMFSLGHFDIIPFRLHHDVPCFGFLIRHPDMTGNLLFCTDTAAIPYSFDDVQTLMIEADYDVELLRKNEEAGKVHPKLAKRIRESHYSISRAIRFCQNRDLAKLRNVILVHLSAKNSCADDFRRQMIEATGKPVFIASPGLKVEVGNNPF